MKEIHIIFTSSRSGCGECGGDIVNEIHSVWSDKEQAAIVIKILGLMSKNTHEYTYRKPHIETLSIDERKDDFEAFLKLLNKEEK